MFSKGRAQRAQSLFPNEEEDRDQTKVTTLPSQMLRLVRPDESPSNPNATIEVTDDQLFDTEDEVTDDQMVHSVIPTDLIGLRQFVENEQDRQDEARRNMWKHINGQDAALDAQLVGLENLRAKVNIHAGAFQSVNEGLKGLNTKIITNTDAITSLQTEAGMTAVKIGELQSRSANNSLALGKHRAEIARLSSELEELKSNSFIAPTKVVQKHNMVSNVQLVIIAGALTLATALVGLAQIVHF